MAVDSLPKNPRFQNLTNKRFGMLTVTGFAGYLGTNAQWNCRCDCGAKTVNYRSVLVSGKAKSCGCMRRRATSQRLKTHGLSRTKEYRIWQDMKNRCYNSSCDHYGNYGGRGITVCDSWRSDFSAFISDMGKRPSAKHSLERKDNNGPYSPENCLWATRAVQSRNTRRTVRITLNGITRCLGDWCEIYGIDRSSVRKRVAAGMPLDLAITKSKSRG